MKRIWVIAIGALLIVLAVGGIAWYVMNNARNAGATLSPDDLAAVTRGDLIATVSATGAIKARSSADLAFLTSGTLNELLFKRGDKVKAGQPILKLDAGELELAVTQAEANLNLAQAKLTQLQKGGTQTATAAAQANLDSAQASLASAQAAYNKLLQPDPNDVAQAQADVSKARAALDQAQAAYDRVGGGSNPNIGMMPQSLQLQQATLDYQKAVTAYNARFKATDAQLKAAQAQVQAAQAQVQAVQDQLARLTPTTDDIAQAQASVDVAKAGRDLAKKRLDEAVIVAPFDGTIVAMDLDKGDFIQAGKPVVTVADIDHLQITLNIDETDIPRVALGQKVAMDLDAFPGQTIAGTVSEIAPGAATVQGVVNYEVKIDVAASDMPVKMGMTANANVEVAHKNNVLLVPNRAVRASNNKRYVTIYANAVQKEVQVQLGLSNDQESEVISGINEGDQVVTAVTTQGLPGFSQPGASTGGK
ncbi:MAG: efflux RND transporter periplasmic adaptor subunit [Anaerolineae bacterium]